MGNHKYTPGPWEAEGRVITIKGTFVVVAECDDSDLTWADGDDDIAKAEIEATAKLIAAAPEMLEALKDLERTNGKANALWDRVRRLIAKAEGRDK